MRVILNVDAIQTPLTGIGHYALQLALGLQNHPAIHEIRLFSAYQWVSDPQQALQANHLLTQVRRHIPFKTQALNFYNVARSNLFHWRTKHLKNYLLHTPNYILMPFSGVAVTTVHDLSYVHYPEHHPAERIAFMQRQMPKSLEQAKLIITDSEFVRQELIELLNVDPHRIQTVALGVSESFHPRQSEEVVSTLWRHDLADKAYLLIVATLEPRKNLLRLIEAYSHLSAAIRQSHPLVIAGAQGWLTEALERRLAPLKRNGEVKQLGYLLQEELPLIYSGAHAFAFPSLYEGFGLPVLEAMASGIPTLTSNRSSLPEVAGDAALLVDPEDVDALTAGLERLLTDSDWRAAAIERGLRQASRFSWTRCVDETVAVYERALAS